MINAPPDTLDALLDDCWKRLVVGAANRRSAFHQAVVATVDTDGAPEARIMVLRLIDRAERLAQLHTDQRSAKLDHLAREGRASLLFYDPGVRIQLRLGGRVRIHCGDDVAEAAWARSQRMSRLCYAAQIAPGAVIEAPEDALEHLDPDPSGESGAGEQGSGSEEQELGRGFENFAVLRFRIERMEWLSLAASGHRRARFALAGSHPIGQWLAP
jgi:hypothetical protein